MKYKNVYRVDLYGGKFLFFFFLPRIFRIYNDLSKHFVFFHAYKLVGLFAFHLQSISVTKKKYDKIKSCWSTISCWIQCCK